MEQGAFFYDICALQPWSHPDHILCQGHCASGHAGSRFYGFTVAGTSGKEGDSEEFEEFESLRSLKSSAFSVPCSMLCVSDPRGFI